MEPSPELIDLVRKLVEAENTRNRAASEAIIAPDFLGITRARGVEQDKEAMLNELANSQNPNLRRSLEDDQFWADMCGHLGVVRSVVALTDSSNPQAAPKRFRNMHVFEHRAGQWVCLAWQVTALSAG